jgi:hypothetical protein
LRAKRGIITAGDRGRRVKGIYLRAFIIAD